MSIKVTPYTATEIPVNIEVSQPQTHTDDSCYGAEFLDTLKRFTGSKITTPQSLLNGYIMDYINEP